MPKTFCVVGTDARQRAAARTLAQAGFRVLGAEGAGEADYILLPMPLEEDAASLARILRAARPGTLALGGKISAPVQEAARTAGVELIDYFLRPELELLNAVPTAEGCVALLMQLRDSTVWESDFLILGYGRVGRAVACRLAALGGRVTVAVRSAGQRAAARCAGHHAEPLDALPTLLPRERLACLPADALILDLASRPGGTDFAAAKDFGLDARPALSLPARCAPRTAGTLVAQTVLTILRERSETP